MRYWLSNNDGKASGPYELDEIRRMAAQQALSPAAMLCPEGGAEWVPLASVIVAPPTSPLMGAGAACACCGVSPLPQPKLLYGMPVCKRCLYKFANRRQGAFVIDMMLIWILSFLLGLVVAIAFSSARLDPQVESLLHAGLYLFAAGLLLMRDAFQGCSPGRALLGVRVVDEVSGAPIGPLQSAGRNLLLLIPFAPLVAAVQLVHGPRMGDRLSRTKVVWNRYRDAPVFRARNARQGAQARA
jgi:uncharacterized RDD family membrane protein YckC